MSGIVVTVMAHPDDAELWAGGTLIRHRERGDRVVVTTFADAAGVRAAEAQAGARLMGAECVLLEPRHLGDPNGLAERIEAVIASLRPDTLVTHWGGASHPDHAAVHHATVAAATRTRIALGVPSAVFSCDTYYSQGLEGLFQPAYYVDVTPAMERKLEALRAHRSQEPERWVTMARRMAVIHGARCGCESAEGFGEIPVLGRRLCWELLPRSAR